MSYVDACFGDAGELSGRQKTFLATAFGPTVQSRFPHVMGGLLDDVLSAIGDVRRSIVSIEGDCAAGEAAVREMLAMFEQAGSPAAFAKQAETIKSAYDQAEASAARSVPYSPICGQIYALGKQAQALTREIAQSAGIEPPTPIINAGGIGLVGLGLISIATWAGVTLYRHHSQTSRAPVRRRV